MAHNPELKKKINQILREIGEYSDLDALAVVNREGMKISFFAKKGIDPDLLSAISAAILSTGEKAVSYNDHGELLEVLVRGEKGFTILSNAGDYILIGTSLELNSMGLTIRVLRKYASKLQDIISGDISDEIGPINEQNIYTDLSYTIPTSENTKLAFGVKGGISLLSVGSDFLTPDTPVSQDQAFDESENKFYRPGFDSVRSIRQTRCGHRF